MVFSAVSLRLPSDDRQRREPPVLAQLLAQRGECAFASQARAAPLF